MNGRIVLDEPTDLPDGTVLELIVDEGGDSLDDEDRERLHASIREGMEQIRRGEVVPAEQVLAELRARRS